MADPKPDNRVWLKTVMLAVGVELLGKSGACALNAQHGNTLELKDGYIVAYSAKTKRSIGVPLANVKAFEYMPTEPNPLQGRNRRAAEAREQESRQQKNLSSMADQAPAPTAQ